MSLSAKDIPTLVKFSAASTAGMIATMVCYPMDVTRLRMQLVGEGKAKAHRDTTFTFMLKLFRNEGFGTFYNGISASLMRQFLYVGGRLGTFQVLMDYIIKNGGEVNFTNKMIAGTISGCIGAVIGLPPDVVLTRMAVDNASPPGERRNYKNVFDALYRMATEEGISTWSTGLKVTILRSVIVNCSQLVTYTETKQAFLRHDLMADKLPLHFVCSIIATLILTVCALPADMAKTRLQKMRIKDGVPEYKGFLDVWFQIIKREGIFSIWKGFTPFFIKTIPYSMILLIVYEDVLLANYKRFLMPKKE